MEQTIQVSEIEMIVKDTKENLQDVIDAILCSASILSYGIQYTRERGRIVILIWQDIYCFHVNFYFYEENGKNILKQIYVTDSVDGNWNHEFRQKRYLTFGSMNSIDDVGFFQPLNNALKAISCLNPKTGNFNKVG